MRYQSALVLSTIAITQAVASDVRHAHFHARHNAEEKRNAHDVDWKRVANDVYGMDQSEWDTLLDWKTVNYGGGAPKSTSVAAASTSAPAPAQGYSTSSTAAQAQPTNNAPETKPSSSSSQQSQPEKSSTPSTGTGDLSQFSHLGVKNNCGDNLKSKNDVKMWLGDDGEYKVTVVNDASEDAALLGWNSAGMWVNANQPQVYVALPAGQSVDVSLPYGFSGGLGVAYTDTVLSDGQVNESILEFTAKENQNGCFDVSREINMKGIVMGAVGSKCSSGLIDNQMSCTFICNDKQKCGSSDPNGVADFNINLGTATKGPCMVGKDPFTGAPSGGCQMGSGEHVKVTVSNSRSWPAAY